MNDRHDCRTLNETKNETHQTWLQTWRNPKECCRMSFVCLFVWISVDVFFRIFRLVKNETNENEGPPLLNFVYGGWFSRFVYPTNLPTYFTYFSLFTKTRKLYDYHDDDDDNDEPSLKFQIMIIILPLSEWRKSRIAKAREREGGVWWWCLIESLFVCLFVRLVSLSLFHWCMCGGSEMVEWIFNWLQNFEFEKFTAATAIAIINILSLNEFCKNFFSENSWKNVSWKIFL